MPPEETREELRDFRHVGPATAAVLEDADVGAEDLEAKGVSHAQLVAAGVNPGVAARIRREHSLPWSFEGGQDLDRRAEQVRGLQDDERQWVAASYGDEASADGSGDAAAGESAWRDGRLGAGGGDDGEQSTLGGASWPNGDGDAEGDEAAWREQSAPKPVTDLDAVDESTAELLARAGITSVRSLASVHVEEVSNSLELPEDHVRDLKTAAEAHGE